MERPNKQERKTKAVEQRKLDPIEVNHVLKILRDSGYSILKIEKPRERGRIKYSKIVEEYELATKKNIIWIKFAMKKAAPPDERYVGVVGAGYDINRYWNNKNTSGMLIEHAELVWDESLVLIIPVWPCEDKKRGVFERAIGDLLIKNDVPIIDYYSHHF